MTDMLGTSSKDSPPTFEIVLPAGMHDVIRRFLFDDPTNEAMGVILAGVNESPGKLKLLGRQFVPVPPDAYEHRSAGGLAVRREFSRDLLRRCASEDLSQIDVHSHPFGVTPSLWFSGVDDRHEQLMAEYIYARLKGSLYASLVMNQGYSKARIWLPCKGGSVAHHPISTLVLAEAPFRRLDITGDLQMSGGLDDHERDCFARQVLAFGEKGQMAMSHVSVGVIGVGGIGSAMIEGLARLGVRNVTIIDPDVAEMSNVNRVSGMTLQDAQAALAKVEIARRNFESIVSKPNVSTVKASAFSRDSIEQLKECDIIVAATDNHATRMLAQRIGAQYLIPVISVGVNIDVGADGTLEDVSGEFAIALPGEWCLSCARIYDAEMASIELADVPEKQRWIQRGYINGADVKAPAVSHLNVVVANLALTEIHNLLAPFKAPILHMGYNQLRGELVPYMDQRNPNCAICSDSALLGMGDLEPIPDYEQAGHKRSNLMLRSTDEWADDGEIDENTDLIEEPVDSENRERWVNGGGHRSGSER